jgi:O-acetyl-ADP-ribose deacetylase (regulator of RNase III)
MTRAPSINVVLGDISTFDCDAIVNAANQGLRGGGGVDGAIHRRAGAELRKACHEIPEVEPGVRCPVGEARITPGFDLSAKAIIHTVGPVWAGGDQGEEELLASCYRNSLQLAAEHGLRTIAFPAISCGVFGFPVGRAAEIVVNTIHSFPRVDELFDEILLVAFDDETANSLRRALSHEFAEH